LERKLVISARAHTHTQYKFVCRVMLTLKLLILEALQFSLNHYLSRIIALLWLCLLLLI